MRVPAEVLLAEGEELVNLPSGSELPIRKLKIRFQRWDGPCEFLDTLPRTLSNKPLVRAGNSAAFAELAIVQMLERDGWQAFWVDSFHRAYRSGMPPSTGLLPVALSDRLGKLRGHYRDVLARYEKSKSRRGEFGGIWDILASKPSQMLFVEAKRAGKDRIRWNQLAWLQATLESGGSSEEFLIVEWDI